MRCIYCGEVLANNDAAMEHAGECHIMNADDQPSEAEIPAPPVPVKFTRWQIRWGEKLGLPTCHYMTRWVIVLNGYGIRLHHWLSDDDQRHFHDHPWWMWIFILRGGYTDISPEGEDHLKAGSLRYRVAEHKHTVRVNAGGCWSLLFTGPVTRHWGFWVEGRKKLLRPLRYFQRFGHHPCD